MDEITLQDRINMLKDSLINLANKKKHPLNDPEVYRKSCELDLVVVEYTKRQMNIKKTKINY